MNKNRWLIALFSALIHLSIGSVYAYSVLIDPLGNALGWAMSDIKWAFSLAILFLGLSAAFLGPVITKMGPRKSGMICGILYGCGIAISGLAVQQDSLPLFFIGYGVIGGIGLGIGYLAPIPTLIRWFPDKKGVGTGICVMGFGLAALVFGPLIKTMFDAFGHNPIPLPKGIHDPILQAGIAQTLYILGAIYFAIIFLASQYLANPSESTQDSKTQISTNNQDLTLAQAARTPHYYLIWMMFFLNILCGISLISVAAKMGKELIHLETAAAVTLVGLLGLFNGAGRFIWAAISDRIGRVWTYRLFYLLQMGLIGTLWTFYLLGLLASVPHLVFEGILCLWITCYGGGFSVLPSFLGESFGRTYVGSIQGATLTAWSLAGLAGPWLITTVHDSSGSYGAIFPFFLGFLVLALMLSFFIRKQKQSSHQGV